MIDRIARTERSYSASTAASTADASGPPTRAMYRRNVPGSARASESSALSTIDAKNGQRPMERPQALEARPAAAIEVRLERGPDPVPARQVRPRLRPGEDPRDGAEAVEPDLRRRGRCPRGVVRRGRAPAGSGDRPRTESEPRDLGDRRGTGEHPKEPGHVDEAAIRGPRERRELGEDEGAVGRRAVDRRLVLRARREERRGDDLLEMASGDLRAGVVGRDHLALLGEPEPARDRAGRLGEDGPARRTAAAPDRPAAAVEQRQRDAVAAGHRDERALRLVERPVRGEEPGLLGRVGVAEHHLLAPGRPSRWAR